MKFTLSSPISLMVFFFLTTATLLNAQCISGVRIESQEGFTNYSFCKDGSADLVGFQAERAGKLYAYAVVDTRTNRIKILTTNPVIDFEPLATGVYRVYGINYAGTLDAPGGLLGAGYLASTCSATSPNWITVSVTIPDGGVVFGPGGSKSIDVCVGPGQDATLSFTGDRGVMGAIDNPANYAFLVTNEHDVIIGVSLNGVVNFANAGGGECRVYGFAYTGDLAVGVNSDLDWAMSTACSDVSDNYVTVNRQFSATNAGVVVQAGTNATTVYSCPGDGSADVLAFVTNARGGSVTYLATDAAGNILAVSPSGAFDFEGAGIGNCRVYSLAYDGDLATDINSRNVNGTGLSTGCFDVSNNFVQVVRSLPDGGFVDTEEGTTVEICVAGDGIADIIDVESVRENTLVPGFTFVVTNENGQILTMTQDSIFNFDGAGNGNCRIYGLSYHGTLNTSAARISDELADDCFDLSDNFILVKRTVLRAGPSSPLANTVALQNGSANVGAIAGFGSIIPPLYEVAYLLTEGDELEIVQVNFKKPLFTVTTPGVYRVHTVVAELNIRTDRNYIDLNSFIGDSVVDILQLIANENICADIDAVGATTVVVRGGRFGVTNSSLTATGLQLSPNPATHEITLSYQFAEEADDVQLRVFDLLGKQVFQQTLANTQQQTLDLDVQDWKKGAYILQLTNGQQSQTTRFVKQ